MLNRERAEKPRKLAQEILGLFGASAAISLFFFGFFNATANSLVISYCGKYGIDYTQMLQWTTGTWIRSISLVAAAVIFIVLFLFLMGQKIAYLKEIILGIEALRTHRMDYEISLEGNNEFTELAESINYLSRTEKELLMKESLLREEREELIRNLSHDIRTPLTTIMSYSEYMKKKDKIEKREMDDYIALMQQKAEQIKLLTNQLLDGGARTLVEIEDGRFLMEQLAAEWEAALENHFNCEVNLKDCPSFLGRFDIRELRRIFDNLGSNIEKYADPDKTVYLNIFLKEKHLLIEQKNGCKKSRVSVESSKIGIESIRKIAEYYGGGVEVRLGEEKFSITITLMELKNL